jgi:hypothetical protein
MGRGSLISEVFGDPASEPESTVERDLTIIRRDIVAVLQETADVRATMNDISSSRRGASRRFILLAGLMFFLFTALLVLGQAQLRSWLPLM